MALADVLCPLHVGGFVGTVTHLQLKAALTERLISGTYSTSDFAELNAQDLLAMASLFSADLMDEESLIALLKNRSFAPAIDLSSAAFIAKTVLNPQSNLSESGPVIRATVSWLNRVLMRECIEFASLFDQQSMCSMLNKMAEGYVAHEK